MDAIDIGIQKGFHKCDNSFIIESTWEDFENSINDDTILVLFGIGKGADYFFFKYGERYSVSKIVDNDKKCWGVEAREVISDYTNQNGGIRISSVDCLRNLPANKIVVVISSLKRYSEIFEELQYIGIEQCFSVMCMEANNRQKYHITDSEKSEVRYVRKGCEEPIDNNKICLLTMQDNAGHGKEIARCLLSHNKELDIVWIVKNYDSELPFGVRRVWHKATEKMIYEIETSHIWLCDTGIPDYIIKRNGQIYIQLKHWSSITLKMFGFDLARYRDDKEMLEFCISDSKKIDYILTGSEFDNKTCRSGFDFHGQCVNVGSPRSDALFRAEECKSRVLKYYPEIAEKKIAIYAPTFRSIGDGAYHPEKADFALDYELILNSLKKRFSGNWTIMMRLHPVLADQNEPSWIANKEYIIDATMYDDSEELVSTADVLITDYSSIMFEPAFCLKPVFLLSPDIYTYMKLERGFLIDYDELPFPIADSNESLEQLIVNFDENKYKTAVSSFLSKYGVHEDGKAAERACKFIYDMLETG